MTKHILSVVFVWTAMATAALAADDNPYPSTYEVTASPDTLISNVRVLIGDGRAIESGYVLVVDGEISVVSTERPDHPEVREIDGAGKWLTPGIIDVHSHLGNYPSPGYPAHSDGNEATDPVTAEVWTEHSVWPQDPQFPLALEGGVTTLQILPGSANLFGGRSVVVKNVPSSTVQGMKFPGAPYGLKMACGENPKRVYGGRNQAPSTRMGNVAGYRAAWIKAVEYKEEWQRYREAQEKYEEGADEDKMPPEPPERDLELDTLVGVLDGEILVHNHCYRADEMAVMIDMSQEFDYKITAFHHAVESYKIADLLAEHDVCSAMWADWWRFKLESFDGIKENVPLVDKAGACAIVHSDSPWGIQRLNQEAAKAMAAGQRMGMDIDRAEAIRWITLNAAKALGIEDKTGSIEEGKMADLVLWSGDPFSIYSKAEKVLIDGHVMLDVDKGIRPTTDFELGQRAWRSE